VWKLNPNENITLFYTEHTVKPECKMKLSFCEYLLKVYCLHCIDTTHLHTHVMYKLQSFLQPGGCVAQTGTGMKVGQQILQVNDTSLKGLKHRDTVMTIKNAFEGPLNKTIKFVVMDCQPDE